MGVSFTQFESSWKAFNEMHGSVETHSLLSKNHAGCLSITYGCPCCERTLSGKENVFSWI